MQRRLMLLHISIQYRPMYIRDEQSVFCTYALAHGRVVMTFGRNGSIYPITICSWLWNFIANNIISVLF